MIFNAYQSSDVGIGGISIVSSGHIFAEHGRQINRPKGRGDFLLFYVAKGKELFYLDTETIGDEGSFIIFRPREKQKHIYTDSNTGEFYYIHFNAPEEFDLFGFQSSRVYLAQKSTEICDLFEEIISELQTKQPMYEKICVSKFFNILSLLERNIAAKTNPQNQYANKIFFVIQKMNREYDKNHSLEEYAAMCNMSKFHFLRVFKEITGTSPIEYRNQIKIDHAKEFLENTTASVSEIAGKVGYPSNSYFCDAFKSKTGLSPSQYRKSIKNNYNL